MIIVVEVRGPLQSNSQNTAAVPAGAVAEASAPNRRAK